MSTSLLVTAQHSEPYRKIGRMHVLYNFSFSLDYSNTNIIIITWYNKYYFRKNYNQNRPCFLE